MVADGRVKVNIVEERLVASVRLCVVAALRLAADGGPAGWNWAVTLSLSLTGALVLCVWAVAKGVDLMAAADSLDPEAGLIGRPCITMTLGQLQEFIRHDRVDMDEWQVRLMSEMDRKGGEPCGG